MPGDGIIRIGNNGVRPVGSRTRFDPATGVEEVLVYEGEEDALRTEASNVMLSGLGKAEVYPHDGPSYRMDVVLPDDPATAADNWERVTEFVQEDFRENPKVISIVGTSATLALWVFQIKQALAGGQALTAVVPAPPASQQLLYDEMARGVTSHELRRIVLRRRRTIPIGWTSPRVPTAVEQIFTTGAMVRIFGIPPGVQAILPATPGFTPSGRDWGWKVRQDDSVLVPSTRKTQEVMQWTFAAWSTSLLYDLVT